LAENQLQTQDSDELSVAEKMNQVHELRLVHTADNLAMTDKACKKMQQAMESLAIDAADTENYGPNTRMKLCMTVMELNQKSIEASRELVERIPYVPAEKEEDDVIDGDPDDYLIE